MPWFDIDPLARKSSEKSGYISNEQCDEGLTTHAEGLFRNDDKLISSMAESVWDAKVISTCFTIVSHCTIVFQVGL